MTDGNINRHDDLILRFVYPKSRPSRRFMINQSKYPMIIDYLVNRYDDSKSIRETLDRIKYHIEFRPICKECGKEVTYQGNGKYNTYCCNSCAYKHTKENRKQTNLVKYGVDNPAKNQNVINKGIETSLRKYGCKNGGWSKIAQEKIKKTNTQKYGVEMPLQSKAIYEKTIKSQTNKYGSVYMGCNDFREKSQQTFLSKYGVNHHMKNNDIASRLSKKLNTKEVKDKIIQTKRKNNTFNTSKPEEILYKKLVDEYGIDDIIRQYKSDVYPFACDFYVKSKDMYIEYQGSWTHGEHPYNPNSEKDRFILEQWEEKAKTSKYYKNAIETWVIRDIKKREIAKRNNLNFVEIWSLN